MESLEYFPADPMVRLFLGQSCISAELAIEICAADRHKKPRNLGWVGLRLCFGKADNYSLTVHLFCQGTKLFFIFSPPLIFVIQSRAKDNSCAEGKYQHRLVPLFPFIVSFLITTNYQLKFN